MSETARRLVDQLRDFRARKTAMDELLMLGGEAVPELVRALGHPMENVRWAARTVLVGLGGDTVVEQLVEALDDAARQEEATAVLQQVTGQSIGRDRQAWAHWLASSEGDATAQAPPAEPVTEAAPAEPPPPETFSDEAIVQAAVRDTDIEVRQHAGGFVLTVPLEGDRRQRVTVSFAASDFEDEPLVVVYTECGPAEAKNFEWALRQNLRTSFGAIAVRDRDGQPTFVMVDTHPRATLDVAELRKAIVLLANRGDKLEKALTKADHR